MAKMASLPIPWYDYGQPQQPSGTEHGGEEGSGEGGDAQGGVGAHAAGPRRPLGEHVLREATDELAAAVLTLTLTLTRTLTLTLTLTLTRTRTLTRTLTITLTLKVSTPHGHKTAFDSELHSVREDAHVLETFRSFLPQAG